MKKCDVCGQEFPEWFIYAAVREDRLIQTCCVCGNNHKPFTADSYIQKLDHQLLWQAYQDLEKYEIIGIPKKRLQLICRALGVLRDLDPEDIRLATMWCSETCREVQATAKDEYPKLRRLVHGDT